MRITLIALSLLAFLTLPVTAQFMGLKKAPTRTPNESAREGSPDRAFYPLQVGARWVYSTSQGPKISVDITGREAINGVNCFVLTARIDGGSPLREWMAWTDEGLKTFAEDSGDGKELILPPRLTLKLPLKDGEWTTRERVGGEETTSTFRMKTGLTVTLGSKGDRPAIQIDSTQRSASEEQSLKGFYAKGVGLVTGEIIVQGQTLGFRLDTYEPGRADAEEKEAPAEDARDLLPLRKGNRWIYTDQNGQKMTVEVIKMDRVKDLGQLAVVEMSMRGQSQRRWLKWTPQGLFLYAVDQGKGPEEVVPPRNILRLPIENRGTWSTRDRGPEGEVAASYTLRIGEIDNGGESRPCTSILVRTESGVESERFYVKGTGLVRNVFRQDKLENVFTLQSFTPGGNPIPTRAPNIPTVGGEPPRSNDAPIGDVEARFEKAARAYDARDYGTALPLFKQLAEAGHNRSQWILALMYQYGRGTQIDFSAAARWYEAAAPRNPDAANNLGVLYREGRGVERNLDRARELFEAASRAGSDDAQLSLGAMHYNGTGMPRNPVEACAWFIISAERGNKNAAKNLDMAERSLGRDTMQKAERRAEILKKQLR